MPTKRDNITEFAIGTKIKFNSKLYEVVEQKFCDECSIATICANSDKTSENPIKVLSKNKRLSVFGECSAIVRSDGKSVVFKEIQIPKSDNINSNIIQPLVEADGTIKDLQIKAPYDYEIDIDNSDLSKGIIRFKNKWMSIEDIYKLMNNDKLCCYRNAIGKYDTDNVLMAIANLIDIASYFNKDWHYDPTKEDVGYAIAYYKFVEEAHYSVCKIDNSVYTYYGNPVFKNEADAQYVIDNPKFRYMLDIIFKV